MRKVLLLFFLVALFCVQTYGQQQIGFNFPQGKSRVEIPIEVINNLVIIPVTVNRFLPLKFVLDTGVETAILTEPDYTPLINPKLVREITISGAGIKDSIKAYVGQELIFELPGGIVGNHMNLLVLDDDYLHLDEHLGTEVQGIIGYDIFKHFVVEIDYDEKLLTLHDPKKFQPSRRQKSIPLEIKNSRSFIKTTLTQKDVQDTVTFMIDSGASHALLLDATQTKISAPRKTLTTHLGTGLGGEIPGKIGRLDEIAFDQFSFKKVLVSIPEENAYGQSIKRGSRHGTLGGEILSRFTPTFDYQNEKLYLTKAHHHHAPFEYDMSGLGLMTKGTFLDTLVVEYVQPHSPASRSGIHAGDVVLSINGLTLEVISLNAINALLKRKPKKKIKLRILRGDRKMRRVFKLRRAI